MLEENIVTLAVAIIGLIGGILGAKYGQQYYAVKSKAGQVLDLFNIVWEAGKDDKITEEEFQAILDKAKLAVEKE